MIAFTLPEIVINPHEDYERDNSADRAYRTKFKLRLFALYNNACALCRADTDDVHIDHLFIPKKRGGNFALKAIDGTWINNAAPLCRRCNHHKAAKEYRWFVTDALIEKNTAATAWLNETAPHERRTGLAALLGKKTSATPILRHQPKHDSLDAYSAVLLRASGYTGPFKPVEITIVDFLTTWLQAFVNYGEFDTDGGRSVDNIIIHQGKLFCSEFDAHLSSWGLTLENLAPYLNCCLESLSRLFCSRVLDGETRWFMYESEYLDDFASYASEKASYPVWPWEKRSAS